MYAVLSMRLDFNAKMPEYYVEDIYKANIQALGGLSIPLNMFLFQEIQRLQEVLELVKVMLKAIQLAIKGEVVMTDALAAGIDSMGDALAPRPWGGNAALCPAMASTLGARRCSTCWRLACGSI